MIDWNRVFDLKAEVGAEGFFEIVAVFLEEVGSVVDKFRANVTGPGLEQELHFLKGGVVNLGFEKLGQLCQAGERLAASGQAHLVDLAAIVRLYDDSRREFVDGIGYAEAA